MIIAIDGPAGSGKSTVAKEVAKRLGFHYLDTGAMYRAAAYTALELGVDLNDEPGLVGVILNHPVQFGYKSGEAAPSSVYVDGLDITKFIRTPEIDTAVSPVASLVEVRRALVSQQRGIAAYSDHVVEGRDIGTTVFPDAELKIFVTASPEERARRRAEQNLGREMSGNFEEIYQAILSRDKADEEREASPLVVADDAILLDTTSMSIDEVIDKIVELAEAARPSVTQGDVVG